MGFRRILKHALVAVFAALVGIAAWEGYAVWRAESRTADILAVWMAKPQPLALAALSSEQKDFLLNRHLSKDQQLTLFINHAYLGARAGRQIHGFAEASLVYFGKPFDQLSRDEYIGLVGMLIGPNEFRPDNASVYNERIARIKALLAGQCKPTGVFDPLYDGCATRITASR